MGFLRDWSLKRGPGAEPLVVPYAIFPSYLGENATGQRVSGAKPPWGLVRGCVRDWRGAEGGAKHGTPGKPDPA